MREWLVYVVIMGVIFSLVFRDQPLIGLIAGLLVSGPLYLGFGYLLAKIGYQRKSWKELRSEAPVRGAKGAAAADEAATGLRPRPAPTSRTGGGTRRPTGGNRRRR
ncbi:MAG: hypothetical protein ABIO83_06800 [Ilumatobacteraceae bacterium]